MFIRIKRYECGDEYEEVDIIPRTAKGDSAVKGGRTKSKTVSKPAQRKLNDKNSRRHLRLLANGNFKENDFMATFDYDNEFLPATVKAAEREIRNFIDRYKRLRKREGVKEPLKYILVTEYKLEDTDGEEEIFSNRVHHHLILSGGINRDLVEDLWAKKKKGQPKKRMGRANIRRLHFGDEGIVGLSNYITKARHGKKGSKRWSSSQNLIKPVMTPIDGKFSGRKVEAMANSNDLGREILEKEYPNHFITRIEAEHSEELGWRIYLKMRKKNSYGKRKKAESPNNKKWP